MEYITMSPKEHEQLKVFESLKNRAITQTEAGYRMGVSDRWVRKKLKRYLEEGDIGIAHRSRGKSSERRWDKKEEDFALDLLKADWQGFGPTFAAEKLEEIHGIKVSKETLRNAMIRAGVWSQSKRRKVHRKRRERRPMKGLLVQLDGSPHHWFEGRSEPCTLLVFIDDATSQLLWLEFVKSENLIDVMRATKNYILAHGRPHEFYVDFGSVFSVNTNNPERDKLTQWERAVENELGIKVSHAHSPQAKGRVERSNKTLQDRLIKEMRLARISSMETANKFALEVFIPKHNKRFPVKPSQQGDGHRPFVTYDLDSIFCIKETRVLANDYVIRFDNRLFQVDGRSHAIRPKNQIVVNTHLDGTIRLSIDKTNLFYTEIFECPKLAITKEKPKIDPMPHKPSRNSRFWASGRIPAPIPEPLQGRVGEARPAGDGGLL